MSTALVFDTHAYVKKLKAVGFTEEQAEVQAEVIADMVEDKLATKADLKELELATKAALTELDLSVRRELAETKADIIKWVAGMLVAQAAVIAAMIKLIG